MAGRIEGRCARRDGRDLKEERLNQQTQTELWQMHDDAIAAAKAEERAYSGRYSRHTLNDSDNKTKVGDLYRKSRKVVTPCA